MTGEIRSDSVPLEERVLRCDACGKPFLLVYRRPNVAQRLSDTVVTSCGVRCPSEGCHHPEPVIVPVDAYDVTVAEWLGTSDTAESSRSLKDVFRGPSSR